MSVSVTVPRTAALRGRLINRMKFLFGKRVMTGKRYDGCRVLNESTGYGACRARRYDPKEKLLMLEAADGHTVIFVSGDMAVWRSVLYADGLHTVLHTDVPVDRIVSEYAAARGAETVTEAMAVSAITERWPRLGRPLCACIAAAVTAGE